MNKYFEDIDQNETIFIEIFFSKNFSEEYLLLFSESMKDLLKWYDYVMQDIVVIDSMKPIEEKLNGERAKWSECILVQFSFPNQRFVEHLHQQLKYHWLIIMKYLWLIDDKQLSHSIHLNNMFDLLKINFLDLSDRFVFFNQKNWIQRRKISYRYNMTRRIFVINRCWNRKE